jgi:hypothetical protein
MKTDNNRQIKKGIINFKIYFDRARMYLGYINFFMLNVVLFNSSEGGKIASLINENRILWIPLLFVFYLAVLIFIGYLDTRLGLRQEEFRNNAMNNPVIRELIESVRVIKKEVAPTLPLDPKNQDESEDNKSKY